jgi:hypothetical protein
MTTLSPQADMSPPAQDPPFLDRVLWRSLAALAGVLPAAGAAYATRAILELFKGISDTGSSGIGMVSAGLSAANRPVLVAFTAAALFAAVLSIAWSFKPAKSRDFPDVLLSALVLIAAGISFLLLWRTESLFIAITADRITMTVSEASTQMAYLLIAGFFGPLLLCGLLLLGTAISMVVARPLVAAPLRLNAALWIAITLLLVAMALSFYARASYLEEAALRGSFS